MAEFLIDNYILPILALVAVVLFVIVLWRDDGPGDEE